MRKLIWTLVIVVLVAVFGGRAWFLHKQANTEKDVVKIGLILPLSGDASRDGQEALLAAKMAQDEINQASTNKVILKSEDSKYASKTAISAFNKLYGEGVDSVIVFGDVPSLAVIPLLKDSSVPMAAMAGDAPIPSMSPWVFQALIPIKQIATTVSNYLVGNLKLKKIALLYVKCPGGEQFVSDFRNETEKLGGQISAEESFRMGDMDTKAQITKILTTNPDAIFVYGWGPGYVSALNYLKQMRYAGTIMTDFNIVPNTNILVKKGKDILYLDLNAKENGFAERFHEKHGVYPNIFTTFIYESVRVFANSTKAGQTKEMTRNNLVNQKGFATSIGNISFDNDGNIYGIETVIKQMQPDGTAKVIKE
ncbi:MAG: ABC transporter substrate-binding protein [Alphaproteobacteria bacterium]|nr:ABC transporter substrate-binding protein [Alphaproteobacteria bacterium]